MLSILNASEEDGKTALMVVGSRELETCDRLTLGSVSDRGMRAAVGPVLIYWKPPSGADTRTAS